MHHLCFLTTLDTITIDLSFNRKSQSEGVREIVLAKCHHYISLLKQYAKFIEYYDLVRYSFLDRYHKYRKYISLAFVVNKIEFIFIYVEIHKYAWEFRVYWFLSNGLTRAFSNSSIITTRVHCVKRDELKY